MQGSARVSRPEQRRTMCPKGDGMDSGNTSTPLDIEQYVHVLLRQWRLIAAATVVGVIAATGFLAVVPQQYTATTTINLTVISTEPFAARSAPSSLLDDQEERAIAQSHVVAEHAARTMEGDMTASEIRGASNVTTSSGAAVVSVSFTGDSPELASAGADAVSSAYLSYRTERADERIALLVEGLTTRIDDVEAQVAEIDNILSALPEGDPAAVRHATEREQMLNELDGLLVERNGLQSVDTTAGYVLSAASDNEMESTPDRKLALLTGLAAGFVLGVLSAFLRNPRDRRLRNGNEVTRALGAPILARLGSVEEQVPAGGSEADSLRVARERMLGSVRPGDVVILVDATHANQITPTALNLAVVTAQSGMCVQLIAPEDPRHVRARLSSVLDPGENAAELAVPDGSLHVVDMSDVGSESQADLLVTQEITGAIESAGRRTVTFLVLTSQAPPSSILAALRVSSSMVLIARDKVTLSTEISWLRQESESADTTIVGAIIEGLHRARGDVGDPPASPAHRRGASRSSANVGRLEAIREGESVPAAT